MKYFIALRFIFFFFKDFSKAISRARKRIIKQERKYINSLGRNFQYLCTQYSIAKMNLVKGVSTVIGETYPYCLHAEPCVFIKAVLERL